jgi:lysophospholipase L1-like esterase
VTGSRSRRALTRLVTAVVVSTFAAAGAVAVTGSPAAAAADRGPSITVIGGTMTSRHTDATGIASQGWWSMVGERVGARSVTLSAEGGSSMTAAGNKCQGTTFGDRLRHLTKVDILIVEVGTDNHRLCTPQGVRTIGAKDRTWRIKRYVKQLAARVDALHIRRDRVFFVYPRGIKNDRRTASLRALVKTSIDKRHAGFRFIETPRLHTRETIDGLQPNLAGNRVISQRVVATIARYTRTIRTPAPARGPGPSMAIVGDSITSWYSDEDGSRSQGWWSILARRLGASSVRTIAEGGSGVNVRGNSCTGTTFGERLTSLRPVDVLVVEVGRNDYKSCAFDPRRPSTAPQAYGIDGYVRALSARVAELGMTPSQVFFLTPWGSRDIDRGEPLLQAFRETITAAQAGFTLIDSPVLVDSLTIDGIHPNRAGSEYLAGIVQAGILKARG